jgi:hypothetical protein
MSREDFQKSDWRTLQAQEREIACPASDYG